MFKGRARTSVLWLLLLTSVGCGASQNLEEANALDRDNIAGAAGSYIGSAGGTTAGSAGAGGMGGGGGFAGKEPGSFGPIGSFSLSFSSVSVQTTTGPTVDGSATLDRHFRIDISQNEKSEWYAVLSPDYDIPLLLMGVDSPEALTFSGALQLPGSVMGGVLLDTWQSFSFAKNTDGTLSGSVTVSGQQLISLGDQAWSGALVAQAYLDQDSTPPAAEIPVSAFMSDALLPWDPIQVFFSEPILLEDAIEHTSACDLSGKDYPVLWSYHSEQIVQDSGVVSLAGLAYEWPSDDREVSVDVIDGFSDPTGNSGKGANANVHIIGVPQAISSEESFEYGEGSFRLWGDAQVMGINSDPGLCGDKPGCLVLGPFSDVKCATSHSGVALRLNVPEGATGIQIYYRVLVQSPTTDTYPPSVSVDPLTIQVARLNSTPKNRGIALGNITSIDAPLGDYQFASSWEPINVELPEGTGEIGIAIRTGELDSEVECEGVTSPTMGLNFAVLIDSIVVH